MLGSLGLDTCSLDTSTWARYSCSLERQCRVRSICSALSICPTGDISFRKSWTLNTTDQVSTKTDAKASDETWSFWLLTFLIPPYCGTCMCLFYAMRSCPLAASETCHGDPAKGGIQQYWPDGMPLQRPRQEGSYRSWWGPSQCNLFYGWSSVSCESLKSNPDFLGSISQCNSAQGSPFIYKALKWTWFFW